MELTAMFIEKARKGDPVFITDIRTSFDHLENRDSIHAFLYPMTQDEPYSFVFNLPKVDSLNSEDRDFVSQYLKARVYNILSSYGGRHMDFYYDISKTGLDALVRELETDFGIHIPRKDRRGYGRCINVTDRMLEALLPGSRSGQYTVPVPGAASGPTDRLGGSSVETGAGTAADSGDTSGGTRFKFVFHDIDEKPSLRTAQKESPASSKDRHESRGQKTVLESIRNATENLNGKKILGMDIGGTDIKLVLVIDGEIAGFKEYDWFPASFTKIHQIIDPIILLVRLMRNYMAVYNREEGKDSNLLTERLEKAMDVRAKDDDIRSCCEYVESQIDVFDVLFDAIGLCFPDVVVRNKILGGEVYKTRGIRNNPEIDYEGDFRELTDLDVKLKSFVRPGGNIRFTNDGPMAAFTAAVEMAASDLADEVEQGIFAFTLGTELGTGWLDEKGKIPEIPLEVYNYIIDLGSFPEKAYEPDEARSLNNFNTGLPGTLQKCACQSGVFRLALKYFPKERPDLFKELFYKGFLVEEVRKEKKGYYVPVAPKDMRKPLLEHLMSLPDRENCEVCKRIFREVGEFLAITCIETDDILHPAAKGRILFGRMVKNPSCFLLMQEGARERAPQQRLIAADSSLAKTSLMKQLEDHPHYTVAQFAQAIGSVYFTQVS